MMQNIKDYNDYQSLYKDDLVVAVRKLLNRIDNKGDMDLEDSPEHNALKRYFNKFGLNKKLTKKEVEDWK